MFEKTKEVKFLQITRLHCIFINKKIFDEKKSQKNILNI